MSVDGDGFDAPAPNLARNLNIGGGVKFQHAGWINLDEFPGDGMAPFGLSEQRPFPLPRATFQIVYSSHCLEHLPEEAISNCLRESRRVIKADGALVLKLPDYEATLRAYRSGDHEFFRDRWGLERIAPLWENRGVPDCIESRVLSSPGARRQPSVLPGLFADSSLRPSGRRLSCPTLGSRITDQPRYWRRKPEGSCHKHHHARSLET
jgi:hypothetical protein